MIPFSNRFHGHNSLNYVYKNGKTIRSRHLTIKYLENPKRNKSRIAVVVSKKVIKGAVKRNRIRRRVYECIRGYIPSIHQAFDIVVIVLSSDLVTIDYKDINDQIGQLLRETDIIK